MTTTTWTEGSGNWTDPTWTDGVPSASLDAVADGTSVDPITLTFDTQSGAAHSLSMAYATLAISAGTLTLGNASSLDALTDSGGLLDFAAGGTLAGPASQATGTIAVDSGSLLVGGGGSFAGALSGAGEITFVADAVSIGSGLALGIGTLVVEDTTTLSSNVSDTGLFTLAANGTLDLAGQSFTAGRRAILSGVVEGPGTFVLGVRGDVDGLSAAGNVTIGDQGTLSADGLLTLGTSATDQATLDIQQGAIFDLLHGGGIAANGTARIVNAGTFEDTAPAGTISVTGDITNSGFIFSNSGTFHTVTTDTLLFTAGTFTNARNGFVFADDGNIAFGPGVTDANLVNGTLTGGSWAAYSGTLAITGGPITTLDATIDLSEGLIATGSGTSFTSLQQSLSTIAAGGVLYLDSGGYVTGRHVVDDGDLELAGGDQFGTLSIGTTGYLDELGTLTAESIRNAGTVEVESPGLNVVFDAPFASNGTMFLTGGLTLDGVDNVLDGKMFGPGPLTLGPGSSTSIGADAGGNLSATTIDGGATLTFDVGRAYRGNLMFDAGSTLDLGGHAVTLDGGSLLGDQAANVVVNGGGTLVDAGHTALTAVTFTGGTEFDNRDLFTQIDTITLGDALGGAASLVNEAGVIYTMAGTVTLAAASAIADTVTNAGTFEKAGAGTASIGAAFTNTGTIDVTGGTLEIAAAFTNAGSVIGTEIQSDGTTFITAPSATLFNQYAAATPGAGSASPAPDAAPTQATQTLASPTV